MLLTTLLPLTLITLASAAPSLTTRDKFAKCASFGSNCATQDQRFCDSSTGKISICHKYGSDCWIRYTQDSCSLKQRDEDEGGDDDWQKERLPEAPAGDEWKRGLKMLGKRDEFNKCTVFGASCATDGNQFCDGKTGKLSICHHVGFGSGECWVRHTQTGCDKKRDAEAEVGEVVEAVQVEKRDVFAPCSNFGADCASDGNAFCYQGRQSTCHKVPFTTDCWVRFGASGC